MLISVLTGFAAGAVHVVGGADHLVAMAPFSLRKPMPALRAGLAWGAGHSVGVVVLALIGIGIKDLAHVEAMSAWAEFLVGVALLVVGGLAVRTAFGLELHSHEHHHEGDEIHRHLHLRPRGRDGRPVERDDLEDQAERHGGGARSQIIRPSGVREGDGQRTISLRSRVLTPYVYVCMHT